MKRILIIGTGSIGERHLRCFQTIDGVEVAACEPNETLGRTVAERYGCPLYTSVGEALAAGGWAAAVVCTPAHTHIPIATQCVEAGLDVLIEKPLAVSPEGVAELEALAAGKGATVRVAYVYRSLLPFAKAKELLEGGAVGEPKQVILVNGQHFPTFRPAYRETYYVRHASGGGAIQDALTHGLHGVEWLVGPIERVFTDAAHQVLEGVEVEDTVNLIARLRGGVLASFSLNQFQAPNESFLFIHGTGGSLRIELHARRVGVLARGAQEWVWHDLPVEDRDAAFIRQARSFLDAVEGKPSVVATLAEGAQTLRVNLAALESSRSRKEITL